MARKWEPARTCIACRAKRPKGELLRFVLTDATELTPDFEGRLDGRGAYICKDAGCLKILSRPKAFMRAFMLKSPPTIRPGILRDVGRFLGSALDETA